MRNERKQAGVTLVEMMVVIGIAALMLGLTIPAANMLLNSFGSESGAKSIISSAMASARAIAAKEQRYAGIRFQKRYDPTNPDPLNCSQYIIFIIKGENRLVTHDLDIDGFIKGENRLVTHDLDIDGFHAVDGIQPIKLPDSIGVMDLVIRTNWTNPASGAVASQPIIDNTWINTPEEVNDTTAFSIVFSPSGKLVFHKVRVRNRDGETAGTETATSSRDDVFNTLTKITDPVNPVGMFLQDDYANLGYGSEYSRNSFVIYDTKKLKQTNVNYRWTNYLSQLKPIYINPYTGTIIN